MEQAFDLCLGEIHSAPVGIDGELRAVQPQLPRADLMDTASQPDNFPGGQEPVPAGDDEMHIAGQPVGERTEETGNALIFQQVEIINKKYRKDFLLSTHGRDHPSAYCYLLHR